MKLRCGDYVVEKDGRHVGRVEAIYWNTEVKVKWLDNNYVTILDPEELTRIPRNGSRAWEP